MESMKAKQAYPDLAALFLDIYLAEMCTDIHKDMYKNVCSHTIHNSQMSISSNFDYKILIYPQ